VRRRDEIISRLSKVIEQSSKRNITPSNFASKKSRHALRQIGRAYGVLTYAHAMPSKEALNLLSIIKLGTDWARFQKTGACRLMNCSSRRNRRICKKARSKN